MTVAKPAEKKVKKVAAETPAKPATTKPSTKSSKVDAIYATGKRKNAIAKVWLSPGNGKMTINGKDARTYLGREILFNIAKFPLEVTGKKVDVDAKVLSGGISGQAGAIAHGISKALVILDPETHTELRVKGFLTRDPRVVERKKYGLKKARKGRTYRKR